MKPFLLSAFLLATSFGCKPGPDKPLGAVPSFVLFVPTKEPGSAGGLTLRRSKATEGVSAEIAAALNDGFAAEVVRTVFVTQQYIANTPHSTQASAKAWANDAVAIVVGADHPEGPVHGGSVEGGWLGGAVVRPQMQWVGVPDDFRDPASVVAVVSARLGKYLGVAADTAGTFAPGDHPLATAYGNALEVIAREWRATPGGAVVATTKLDARSAALFAGVRENRFVLDDQGRLKSASELLRDPLVAATVFYRWFQDKHMAKRVADEAFYAPLKNDRVPPGISPAAVLGPFRNLQMKVLGAWIDAVLRGEPPVHIAGLVSAYGKRFPEERAGLIRLFVATTYGATAQPGGVSAKPSDAATSLVELKALSDDVISGKKPLLVLEKP